MLKGNDLYDQEVKFIKDQYMSELVPEFTIGKATDTRWDIPTHRSRKKNQATGNNMAKNQICKNQIHQREIRYKHMFKS